MPFKILSHKSCVVFSIMNRIVVFGSLFSRTCRTFDMCAVQYIYRVQTETYIKLSTTTLCCFSTQCTRSKSGRIKIQSVGRYILFYFKTHYTSPSPCHSLSGLVGELLERRLKFVIWNTRNNTRHISFYIP